MLSIRQATRLMRNMGKPLPGVIRPLEHLGCHLRAGEVSLWAAGSGTGKSVLCLWIATGAKVPTLYFSADSNQSTMAMRQAAMLSGLTQSDCEEHISAQEGRGWDVLNETQHMKWCFDSAPSLSDIEEEVSAFYVANGQFPEFIVIDNLRNVSGGIPGDEYTFWDEVMAVLHDLARATQAHIAITHHVTGSYASGDRAIPLGGLEQKVDKRAEVVVTAHRPSAQSIYLSVAKNRDGQARADGSLGFPLLLDGERMQIAEIGGAHYD